MLFLKRFKDDFKQYVLEDKKLYFVNLTIGFYFGEGIGLRTFLFNYLK